MDVDDIFSFVKGKRKILIHSVNIFEQQKEGCEIIMMHMIGISEEKKMLSNLLMFIS